MTATLYPIYCSILFYKERTMLKYAKAFYAGCVGAYDAVMSEVNTDTVVVYDSAVKQCVHNTAVRIVRAYRWFIVKMRAAHSYLQHMTVLEAVIAPIVVCVFGFIGAAIATATGSIVVLATTIVLETIATIYVAYLIGTPVAQYVCAKYNVQSTTALFCTEFAIGFISAVCVCVYKALIISAVLFFI